MGGINCKPGKICCRDSFDPNKQEDFRIQYSKIVGYIFSYIEAFSKANTLVENIMETEKQNLDLSKKLLKQVSDRLDMAVSYNVFASTSLAKLIDDISENDKFTSSEITFLKEFKEHITVQVKNIESLSSEYAKPEAYDAVSKGNLHTYIRDNIVTDLTQNIAETIAFTLTAMSKYSKITRKLEKQNTVENVNVIQNIN